MEAGVAGRRRYSHKELTHKEQTNTHLSRLTAIKLKRLRQLEKKKPERVFTEPKTEAVEAVKKKKNREGIS